MVEVLLRANIPNSMVRNADGERGSDIPCRVATREDWRITNHIVNIDKIGWIVNSFSPFKSPAQTEFFQPYYRKSMWTETGVEDCFPGWGNDHKLCSKEHQFLYTKWSLMYICFLFSVSKHFGLSSLSITNENDT